MSGFTSGASDNERLDREALSWSVKWHETPAAVELMDRIEADEIMSDHYCGQEDGDEIARAFANRAADLELRLDDRRGEAIEEIASRQAVKDTPQWWDAWCEADEMETTVRRAREMHRANKRIAA